MPGAASDDDLMRRLARGDEGAFDLLFHRHRQWVAALAKAVLRDEDGAEDVAQEAFHRVLRESARYDPKERFVPWLKRITVNLSRDALRERARKAVTSLGDVSDVTPSIAGVSDPLTIFETGAMRGELLEALRCLPEEQRRALVLRYYHGQTIEEIARSVGCPAGTVKSRIHNGLRRIRVALERNGLSPTAEQPPSMKFTDTDKKEERYDR